jgi:DUF1009 family protein
MVLPGATRQQAEPVALIAGAGRLPLLAAEGILGAGKRLVLVALRGFASPRLAGLADETHWVGLTRLGGWVRAMKRAGACRAVMVGSVRKADMYSRLRLFRYVPDLRTARLWYRTVRHDKRDNAVLLAVADELAAEEIELVSSMTYCSEHLADEGVLTQTPPGQAQAADIDFAWPIARDSARLDIGQSLAVRERDIIAVEAIEGTDAMVARAGQLCPTGGWTLIKVARPEQDMRFDVPTVGPATLRNLAAAGCACLVVEAGRTVILDKPDTLVLADRLHIAVVGKSAEEPRPE